MSSLSIVQRTFYWDRGALLSGKTCVVTGAHLSPNKCFEKALISRITLRYFITLDFIRILYKHFINLLTPQQYFLFFASEPSNLGLLKTKTEKN